MAFESYDILKWSTMMHTPDDIDEKIDLLAKTEEEALEEGRKRWQVELEKGSVILRDTIYPRYPRIRYELNVSDEFDKASPLNKRTDD